MFVKSLHRNIPSTVILFFKGRRRKDDMVFSIINYCLVSLDTISTIYKSEKGCNNISLSTKQISRGHALW